LKIKKKEFLKEESQRVEQHLIDSLKEYFQTPINDYPELPNFTHIARTCQTALLELVRDVPTEKDASCYILKYVQMSNYLDSLK
jgi:hypothetical protein